MLVTTLALSGSGYVLSIPVGTLVVLLIAAALAGLLAAQLPARRAARLDVAGGARRRLRKGRLQRPDLRVSSQPMAAVAPSEPSDPELQATAWDLEPLVGGEGPDGVESRLSDALVQAQAFAARYAGKLGDARRRGPARGDGGPGRHL